MIGLAKLVIYHSPDCEACKKLVPMIERKAKAKGWSVTKKNVDTCHTKECQDMAFVPLVKKDGKTMSDGELRRLIK